MISWLAIKGLHGSDGGKLRLVGTAIYTAVSTIINGLRRRFARDTKNAVRAAASSLFEPFRRTLALSAQRLMKISSNIMDDSSSELAGALAALTSCINAPPEPSTFQAVADALANTCRILGNCDAIAASQTPLALLQQAVQLLSQTCLALHQNVSTGWFNPDLASLPVWDSHFLPMLDVCFFSDR